MTTIKVLGGGCANCNALEKNALEAVANLGVEVQVEHVKEMAAIMSYGVMRTPALVVNEKVVVSGRVPSVAELQSMLTTMLV
ncbi:MAG: thioredoxin family protein [Mycobacterium leprae]